MPIFWLLSLVLGVYILLDLRHEPQGPSTLLDVLPAELLAELSQESQTILEEFNEVAFNEDLAKAAYDQKKQGWYILRLEDGRPAFWNSNKWGVDSSALLLSNFPSYYRFGDDFYVLYKGEGSLFTAYRLANGGELSKRLIRKYPNLRDYRLSEDLNDGWNPDSKAIPLVYQGSNESYSWLVLTLIYLMLLILFFYYFRKSKIWVALFASVCLLGLDIGMQNLLGDPLLVLHKFYQPDLYASSDLLSSLGALQHHLLASIPWIFMLGHLIRKLKYPIWLVSIGLLITFFTSDLVLDLIKGLVLDSSISFSFNDLYGIDFYTFVAVTSSGLGLFALFSLVEQLRLFQAKGSKWIYAGAVLAWLGFVAFQIIDGHRSFVSLLLPAGSVILAALILEKLKPNIKLLALFFLGTLLCSVVIHRSELRREASHLRHFASKLVASQDLRAEYILRGLEDRLAEEFLVPEDYTTFNLRKDVVENRIRQLYFSNYLDKYELRLVSFDSTGVNINNTALYSYEDLDRVYNEQTTRTLSNYFYQINDPSLINGYIAKYENCDIYGHYGTTFILLQPRLIQSDFLYPEAFANQKKKELINLSDYSYSIYFKDRLISQKGSFAYSMNEEGELKNERAARSEDGYFHTHFTEIPQFHVIMSSKYNPFRAYLSTFTFCFVFLIPLAFLVVILLYLFDPKAHLLKSIKTTYLSTRIQLSLTLILLIGLLLSVYIIISYIRLNYNNNLENQLLSSIKNIGAQFQNQVDLERKLGSEEQRQLLINQESNDFKVDLNLYNRYGQLLTTTKSYLINEEILGAVMNPKAFERMQGDGLSHLLLQEELEGTDYISAYTPLFNGKNELIAYLNLPYFAKNEQLSKQISTVLVNVVNIYFLVLLIGVFIALVVSRRISRPLLLIQNRFASTGLGMDNEPIVYHRDDEIGQLVRQYNQMLIELEESAAKLAQTEREGAWKEMAKQVAHEIKNPLTPMKLSIQHLQRAYEQGGDKVDALFKKTSTLLIEQIESLSRMASEFSSFAKMPEDNYEAVNLSEILRRTHQLFEQTDGVEIEGSIEPELWVFADPEQLKRVFNNLIKNAIQAIPEGRKGKIGLEMQRVQDEAVIRISDNGKGISKRLGQKVFEPNFSTKTSGMGLGLAICKKIIETAKGQIDFRTEEGKGTTFELRLPLYHESS